MLRSSVIARTVRGTLLALLSLSSLVTLVSLFACRGELPHPTYSPQPTSALVEVEYPPPPARAETVPARPTDDAVWIDGEWTWRRRRWAWNPGRWVEAPAGATYSPWTAVRASDGTFFYAPGAWRDAHGAAVTEPKPLALAGITSNVIFDAEGDVQRAGRVLSPDRTRLRDAGGDR